MSTDADIVAFFHRHVVLLVFTFRKDSKVISQTVTAFVLSVSDHWFLITAGHCIRQIEQVISQDGFTLVQCQLIDSLGAGASHFQAIPFTYDKSLPISLSDDFAFDYGVMILSPYYRHLLETNKIQALNEEVWKKQPTRVDLYVLLGIPGELVEVTPKKIDIGSTLHTIIQVPEKPDGFSDVDAPLFYGRIVLGEGQKSIQGMSGGPIFGFRKYENGEIRYWLIALQSRWLPDSRFIAACPTKLLGHFLEDIIVRATQQLSS